jgi:exosome complex component RRP4
LHIKLRNGVLVIVPPTLILRLKSHFHSLSCGVDLILGMNGYIWIQTPSSSNMLAQDDQRMDEDGRGEATASMAIYSSQNDEISNETRGTIDRVAACIKILAANDVHISDTNVSEAYQASLHMRSDDGEELDTHQLFLPDMQSSIVAAVAASQT